MGRWVLLPRRSKRDNGADKGVDVHRLALGLLLIVAACSPDAGSSATTQAPGTTSLATTTSVATTTTAPTTTTTSGSTTTTTSAGSAIPDSELPGEPWDFGVVPEVPMAVVGVEFDDVLNVRAGPGVGFSIVGTLTPTEENVTITGRARSIDNAIWFEVVLPDGPGWANSFFLGYKGPTNDITSMIVDQYGSIPKAASIDDLGVLVAEFVASVEPPSAVTNTVEASVGDIGEVTYDVVGLGDDAVWAVRLVIFGQKEDGTAFSLKSVEETAYCLRGLTPEGLCP